MKINKKEENIFKENGKMVDLHPFWRDFKLYDRGYTEL
jgi:hypothetical protein